MIPRDSSVGAAPSQLMLRKFLRFALVSTGGSSFSWKSRGWRGFLQIGHAWVGDTRRIQNIWSGYRHQGHRRQHTHRIGEKMTASWRNVVA